MKKTLILCMSVIAMMFTACNNKTVEQQQLQLDSLQAIVDAKDGEIDELFDLLNQIEENLSAVTDKYSQVQNLRNGDIEGSNIKGEIANQIATIETMLADN